MTKQCLDIKGSWAHGSKLTSWQLQPETRSSTDHPLLASACCNMATPSSKNHFDVDVMAGFMLSSHRPPWMKQQRTAGVHLKRVLYPADLAGDMPSPPPSESQGPTPEPKKAKLSWAGQSTDGLPDVGNSSNSTMDEIMGTAMEEKDKDKDMSPKSKKFLDMLDELFPEELPSGRSQESSSSSSPGPSHGKMLQALFEEELPSGLSQEHAASAGATRSQPTALFPEELSSGLSQEHAASADATRAQPIAVAAIVPTAAAPNPKLLHEVKEFFKDWVLPKLDSMLEDAPIRINGFLSKWAPRRYKKHSKKMKKPKLQELREAMKNIATSYGNMRLHLVVEQRSDDGFRISLKHSHKVADKTCATNIGSCKFTEQENQTAPKTAWLYIDMMHLIMLLAEHGQADMATLKVWHEEAKFFLTNMGKAL